MLRNYVVASMRNLLRNRLYSAINVAGLAIGLAAAILIAVFISDELSYDKWIPNHENIFLVTSSSGPASGRSLNDGTTPELAGWMRLDFPEIQAVTRLWSENRPVKHDKIESQENIFWVDSNFFSVFSFPVIEGDLRSALERPDGVVITKSIAQKYFGKDDPVGQVLLINKFSPLRVAAVLADPPSETHLPFSIFATGSAPFSPFAYWDSPAAAGPGRGKAWHALTYFRLKPGASVGALSSRIAALVEKHFPGNGGELALSVTPVAAVHLQPQAQSALAPRGDMTTIYGFGTVGVLLLLVASINYVNLMTAKSSRRAGEVGIRKIVGARRRDLVVQFIGESVIYVAVAAVIATGLVQLLLPALNAFLNRNIRISFAGDAPLLLGIAALTVLLGVLAGVYPALVLSAFRPANVLRGGPVQAGGSIPVRQALVTIQFAVLISLVVSTIVIYQQTAFATRQSLRVRPDEMLLLSLPCNRPAIEAEFEALPGVIGAACSSQLPLEMVMLGRARMLDGSLRQFYYASVGFGYFELYGLQPVAGRLFSPSRITDRSSLGEGSEPEAIVVNEAAVRKFGFGSPSVAVGKTIVWSHLKSLDGVFTSVHQARIIGVVPDFSSGSVRKLIQPAVFYVDPNLLNTLNVKLRGSDVPDSLDKIDKLWQKLGRPLPVRRVFLEQSLQNLYSDVIRQAAILIVFSVLAGVIAGLGLIGLAAFTAERRTKEIGIRKAMGANRLDIIKLFLWQFTLPVLWANLVAWPMSLFLMTRWLQTFAYHIDLTVGPFTVAAALALITAWFTVILHGVGVASAKPVLALRYE